jgi:hypothetical protein
VGGFGELGIIQETEAEEELGLDPSGGCAGVSGVVGEGWGGLGGDGGREGEEGEAEGGGEQEFHGWSLTVAENGTA